jgi:hypothetical protein
VLGVDGSAGVGPTSTWSLCTSLPLQASILDKVIEALPSALVLVGCKWWCVGDRVPGGGGVVGMPAAAVIVARLYVPLPKVTRHSSRRHPDCRRR